MADDAVVLERTLLAGLLRGGDRLAEVQRIVGATQAFTDSRHRAIYEAVIHLFMRGEPVNPYTVAELAGIPAQALITLEEKLQPQGDADVLALAKLLRERADDRSDRGVAERVRTLFDAPTEDRRERLLVAARLILDRLDHTSGYRDPSIGKAMERTEAEMQRYAEGDLIGPSCGLDWFDSRTAGLAPGNVWTVAGPYKGRKTSLLRNILLGACARGASVSMFALEGSQSQTVAALLAMLATRRLVKWGRAEDAVLTPIFVLRGRRSEAQAQALAEARAELSGYNLRIYDAKDGIFSVDVVRSLIRRDKMLHGLDAFALDYLQLLGADGSGIFERMEGNARIMQRTAEEEAVTAVLLVQLNEGAIAMMDSGEAADRTSPGVKGGGDVAAASDYLFMTRYKQQAPNELGVHLWLARFVGTGKVAYEINAPSGLMLRQLQALKGGGR